METSDSIELQITPEDIFPRLQQGIVVLHGQKITTIVPNQTIVSEGARNYNNVLMVVFILFLWPAALIYFFTSDRSRVMIIVTKHGELGCRITINSNGKRGEEVRKYMFLHLREKPEDLEKDKERKD